MLRPYEVIWRCWMGTGRVIVEAQHAAPLRGDLVLLDGDRKGRRFVLPALSASIHRFVSVPVLQYRLELSNSPHTAMGCGRWQV